MVFRDQSFALVRNRMLALLLCKTGLAALFLRLLIGPSLALAGDQDIPPPRAGDAVSLSHNIPKPSQMATDDLYLTVGGSSLTARISIDFIDVTCSPACANEMEFAIYGNRALSAQKHMIERQIKAWMESDKPEKPLVRIVCKFRGEDDRRAMKTQCGEYAGYISAISNFAKQAPSLYVETKLVPLGVR